ncbi:MAG TPA: protein phosphatase 2C domain-containing protein [bacterium]|nr:protein phosphatase 2C domain-containing protein [bacterium]
MNSHVAVVTHRGRRPYNQDTPLTAAIDTAQGALHLLVVLDGMGGMRAGDRASQLAGQVFVAELREQLKDAEPEDFILREAIEAAAHKAHDDVYNEGQAEPEKHGMGTTLVAALFKNDRFVVGNVGDSRAYLYDPNDRSLMRLTRDHSLREEAVRVGALSEEEAARSPLSHALTRSVGSGPKPEVDLFPEPEGWYQLPPGGLLMLCSDGLNNGADDDRLRELIEGSENPATAAEHLMRAGYHGGSRDNITVIVKAHPDYRKTQPLDNVPPPIEEAQNDLPITDVKIGHTKIDKPVRSPWGLATLIMILSALIILFFLFYMVGVRPMLGLLEPESADALAQAGEGLPALLASWIRLLPLA